MNSIIIFCHPSTGLMHDAEVLKKQIKSLYSHSRVNIFHGVENSFKHIVLLAIHVIISKLWFGKSIVINLETIHPKLLSLSNVNIFIPNQECFNDSDLSKLNQIDWIWCKTRHAEQLFRTYGFENKVKYLSFMNNRKYPYVPLSKKRLEFLHLAGKSKMKGTRTICDVWKKNPHWPKLTVVSRSIDCDCEKSLNIEFKSDFLDNSDIEELQTKNLFHLCTSEAEGFGHYIFEAMSCGAVVLTTDAPPMNEIVPNNDFILVKVGDRISKGFHDHLNKICPKDFEDKINNILSLDSNQLKSISD